MKEAPNEYRLGTPEPVMMLELAVTSWCNYRCAYCLTTVHLKRADAQHAFDHHPADRWIAAFGRVRQDFGLLCRGGEPFIDHEGFSSLLAAVGAQPNVRYVRIDTNGSWDPARYDAVPLAVRQRLELNVSFHPTQISLDRFDKRLARILDAGWRVGMINYVMQADQAAAYEDARDHFEQRFGLYTNANPDVLSNDDAGLQRFVPAADLLHKTGSRTKGKSCFYPAISYTITPQGVAVRSCGVAAPDEPARLDFIRESDRLKAHASPVRCPLETCMCLDRYAFLDEHPERGVRLDLLSEYVRDCREHQARAGRTLDGRAHKVWRALSSAVGGKRRLAVLRGERD